MLRIPDSIFTKYFAHLKLRNVPQARNGEYMKWLRYYLDFCNKYPVPSSKAERIRLFCDKLKEKRQTEAQRERAAYAVSLYFEMLNYRTTRPSEEIPGNEDIKDKSSPAQADSLPEDGSYYISEDAPAYSTYAPRRSQFTDAGYQERSASPEWDKVLETMAAEIKMRHYSRKTLKTYALWSRSNA